MAKFLAKKKKQLIISNENFWAKLWRPGLEIGVLVQLEKCRKWDVLENREGGILNVVDWF